MLDVAGRDPDGAVVDVGMAALVARDLDPERILLVLLGQCDDAARKRRREQQRAARLGRRFEDELHILAKAEIEHLIGLVEHDGFEFRCVEVAAAQMIAQPAGRSDDDVGARRQLTLLAPRIHAADAGDDAPLRMLIKPGQFAVDLQGKLTRRRHDQGQRRTGPLEPFGLAQNITGHRQPIGDGLAGAGLGRHQQVAAGGFVVKHRGLNRRRLVAALRSASARASGGLVVENDTGKILVGAEQGAAWQEAAGPEVAWPRRSDV